MTQTLKILKQTSKKIKYVIHLADIHIRRRDRDDEYLKQFKKLHDDLKDGEYDETNSVIVVCGDIIHDKINLHPVSVKLVKEFFVLLCDIAPCVCIAGNHDKSLLNLEHDSLHSIIGKHFKTKHELFLLSDSGLYEYENIIFGHSCFEDNKIIRCDIKTDKYKCGLYHGIVNGAIDENGMEYKDDKNNSYVNINMFRDYDFVFLGDIHKHSFLTDTIAYSGSLIQQHRNESLEKGYIVWNLKKRKGVFTKLESDIGRMKITIDEDGKYDVNYNTIPKNLELDIECMSLNRVDIEKLCKGLEDKGIKILKRSERMRIKNKQIDTKININGKDKDLTLIKTENDVIKLLIDKIKMDNPDNKNINYDDITKVIKNIIKENNFMKIQSKKNIKLLELQFNGMSIYGEKNYIDFKKFNRIMGLNGKNSQGKTAFIDCILCAIYGESSRGNRTDMININKTKYTSSIKLLVSKVEYRIERELKRNSRDKTSTEVKEFIYLYENDKNISGGTIVDTRNLINEKIGTKEDFIMTCLIPQKSIFQGKCVGFTDLTDIQKRDLLCKISRLDIYDKIYTECDKINLKQKKALGTVSNKIKQNYKKYGDKIEENLRKQIDDIKKIELDNDKRLESLINKKEKLNNKKIYSSCELDNLKNQIKVYQNIESIKNIDLSEIEEDINNYKIELKNNEEQLNEYQNQIKSHNDLEDNENIEQQIITLKNKIKEEKQYIKYVYSSTYTLDDMLELNIEEKKELHEKICNKKKSLEDELDQDFIDKYENKKNKLEELESNKEELNIKLESNEKTILMMNDYSYDKNCKYCMKNNETQKKINLENDINQIKEDIESVDNKIEKINKYLIKKEKKYNKQKSIQKELEELDITIQENETLISHYETNKRAVEATKNVEEMNEQLYKLETSYNKIHNEILHLENQILKLNNKLRELCDMKQKYLEYKEILKQKELLLKEFKPLEEELNNINKEYLTLQNKKTKNHNELINLESDLKTFSMMNTERIELTKEVDNLYILLNSLKNNGGLIDSIMTNMIIPQFNNIVNNLIKEFGGVEIKITYINSSIMIRNIDNVSISRDGGYRRFLNNILYRIALSKFNNYYETNFFIIDEATDSADNDNKEHIKNLIKYMKEEYDWILIISHDDSIKETYENVLQIKHISDTCKSINY